MLFGLMPYQTLFRPSLARWSTGAREICHSSRFTSLFFSLGKVVPIRRGDGIYQVGMDFASQKLNQGDWVHIFPEAKVNQAPGMVRFKWGIGRLIQESKEAPLILPFYHRGMANIIPLDERNENKRWYPLPCQKLIVIFGNVIDAQELLASCQRKGLDYRETRIELTRLVQTEVEKLRQWTLNAAGSGSQ